MTSIDKFQNKAIFELLWQCRIWSKIA